MKKSIKDIKIFIGHSIVDLSNNIGDIVGFLNDTVSEQFNTSVETFVCENRSASSQDEINYYIANNADLAVFCFINKVGEYSFEEYKIARDKYKETNFERPKIAVYFKSGVDATKEKKDEIIGDRVYYNDFETFESIKLDLLMLLKSISKETFDFEFTDKDFLINGKKVKNLSIQQLPIYKNNKDVKKLEEQIKELSKKAIDLQLNGEIDDCDEICEKISSLQSQKSMKIQAMLSLSQRFVDDCVNNENDDMISLARLLVKQGNVEKAISLFPSLSQLNSESETIAKVQQDSNELARKEIAKYMELIDYHVLSDINTSRDKINGCVEGIIKLVNQFRVFDFDIVGKLIGYCESRVSTVNIENFLSELIEEKEVRLDKTYNVFALCELFKFGYYDIDRDKLVKRIQDAYFELLEEKNYLKNRLMENSAFSIFQTYYAEKLDPEGFGRVLSRRVEYFLEANDEGYEEAKENQILYSKLMLAKIYLLKAMYKECCELIDSNYEDIIKNVKKNRLSSANLLAQLAELVLIVKSYDYFEEVNELCLQFADELKDSTDHDDQENAISLYTWASSFCAVKGDLSGTNRIHSILENLYKKCIAFNDAKYKMSYLNFLYSKTISDMTLGNIEAFKKDIVLIYNMEKNIDPYDLKSNAITIATNKYLIATILIQAQIFNGYIISDFGLSAYELLEDSGISVKDSGQIMVVSLVIGVIGLYLIEDKNKIKKYSDKLYDLLLKHNEYLDKPELVATLTIFLRVLLQSMEAIESEDYDRFKAIADEIQGNQSEVNDYFASLNDAQNINEESFKVLYKNKEEIIDEDRIEINELSSRLYDLFEKLSKQNQDSFTTVFNANRTRITKMFRLVEYEQGKEFYEKLLALIENVLNKNKVMYNNARFCATAAVLFGYLDQDNYCLDFVNQLKENLFNIFDTILTTPVEDKSMLSIGAVVNVLVCCDEIDNTETISILDELAEKIKKLEISDPNILLIRRNLLGYLLGIRLGFGYENCIKIVSKIDSNEEITEEDFIDAAEKSEIGSNSYFLPEDAPDDDLNKNELTAIDGMRKVMEYVSENDLEGDEFYEFAFGVFDSVLPLVEVNEEYFDYFQLEYFLFIVCSVIEANDDQKYFDKIAEYSQQILDNTEISDYFKYYLLSVTYLTIVVALSENELQDSPMFENAKQKIEEYMNNLINIEDGGKFFALLGLNKASCLFRENIKDSDELSQIFLNKCLDLKPDDEDGKDYLDLYSYCCDILTEE